MNLKGQLSHNLEIGSDPLGNIACINHALESMPKQLSEAQTKIENVERQLETAKIEVEKPFAQEAELAEKLERLSALNALLNMDENGSDAVGIDDAPMPYPVENTRHDYTVGNGSPQRIKLAAAMADKPIQKTSLKEKLTAYKAKAAGEQKQENRREKWKEVTM